MNSPYAVSSAAIPTSIHDLEALYIRVPQIWSQPDAHVFQRPVKPRFRLWVGAPRAHLTIDGVEKGESFRFVYTFIGFKALGEWGDVGSKLVGAMFDFMMRLSEKSGFCDEMVADRMLPLIIERRPMEYQELPALEAGMDFETSEFVEARPASCSLTWRIAVPGVPNLEDMLATHVRQGSLVSAGTIP